MKQKLLSKEEVQKQFPKIPQRGLWYEIIDFSDDDASYSNDWGFYGFLNGNMIYNSGNIASKIHKAGDEAREWKQREIEKWQQKKLESMHRKSQNAMRF